MNGSAGIGVTVAKLSLWLDTSQSPYPLTIPACHASFVAADSGENALRLAVQPGWQEQGEAWRPLCLPTNSWQLWQDGQEQLIFVAPPQSPPLRQVIVNKEFTGGKILVNCPNETDCPAYYPLQEIEIVLFVNWLAALGDVILHASGIELNGEGLCFAGESGAGKSTIIGELAGAPFRVLGEDQVVLRYLDGRFWIFGTPWHTDPARCSAGGAPLRKIIFLDRQLEAGLAPIKPLEGVTRLLQTAFVPYYRSELVPGILARLDVLAGKIPFYTLSYALGSDVLNLIKD